MKVIINIEQMDNGITIKWKDAEGEHDTQAIVAFTRDKEFAIGKAIWEDIKSVMDSELSNKVELKIEYEACEEN